MGVHIPSSLLKHADNLKLQVRVNTFSDRQLKNIAKQVQTGAISAGESATARLAKHIAIKHNSPFILQNSYRVNYKDLPSDHPLFDAVVQACALTKLEDDRNSHWYKSTIDETIKSAEQRISSGGFSLYWLSTTARNIVKASAKLEVPKDHKVHDYIAKLLNREIDTIELEFHDD